MFTLENLENDASKLMRIMIMNIDYKVWYKVNFPGSALTEEEVDGAIKRDHEEYKSNPVAVIEKYAKMPSTDNKLCADWSFGEMESIPEGTTSYPTIGMMQAYDREKERSNYEKAIYSVCGRIPDHEFSKVYKLIRGYGIRNVSAKDIEIAYRFVKGDTSLIPETFIMRWRAKSIPSIDDWVDEFLYVLNSCEYNGTLSEKLEQVVGNISNGQVPNVGGTYNLREDERNTYDIPVQEFKERIPLLLKFMYPDFDDQLIDNMASFLEANASIKSNRVIRVDDSDIEIASCLLRGIFVYTVVGKNINDVYREVHQLGDHTKCDMVLDLLKRTDRRLSIKERLNHPEFIAEAKKEVEVWKSTHKPSQDSEEVPPDIDVYVGDLSSDVLCKLFAHAIVDPDKVCRVVAIVLKKMGKDKATSDVLNSNEFLEALEAYLMTYKQG